MSSAQEKPIIVGVWQHMPVPMISRYLARMGWDWVILDMQHSPANTETAYECLHTLRAGGVVPLARVNVGATSEVQRTLDLGARGVIVPMVNSAEEAHAMVAAAKYPPLGARSMGSDNTWHYGDDYFERANEDTMLLVQVEHINAVRQVELIMAIDGVDGCFVGPTDLALSMGLQRTGYEEDSHYRSAITRTVNACSSHGKLACANTYTMQDIDEKVAQGFDCLTFKSEADFFMASGLALQAQVRERVAKR